MQFHALEMSDIHPLMTGNEYSQDGNLSKPTYTTVWNVQFHALELSDIHPLMTGNEYSHYWKSKITLWEFLQTHLYNSVKCAIPCTGNEWYPSFDDGKWIFPRWEFIQTNLYNSVKCAIPCTGIEWYPSSVDDGKWIFPWLEKPNIVMGISPNPLIQ